jgi:hypothetical protein
MTEKPFTPEVEPILHTFRGHRVILDSDLARLYGVTTKRLNEAVKRNGDRFPSDFAFQLIPEEMDLLMRSQFATASSETPMRSQPVTASSGGKLDEQMRSQIAIASDENGENQRNSKGMRSQFVIASPEANQTKRNQRYLPWAFTEHGALMAATILRSPRAVQMSLYVVRAFIKFRQLALENKDMTRRMAEAELALREHDAILADVYDKLEPLLEPPPQDPTPKRTMGFRKEDGKQGFPYT